MGAQPVSRISRFGPSALLTPANLVTTLRFALTIPLLRIIAVDGVSWRATVGWIILACTDGLDGWLARRDGTTRSGAFLDPLADKFLVLGAMFSLVSINRFAWLPVAIIAVREIGISLYRVYWGRRGLALPASRGGKLKTLLQGLAVAAAVMPPLATAYAWVGNILLWASVVVAVLSAVQYLWAGRSAATTSGTAPDHHH
jgi:CDP-diacylglycerol--glycerol-3-phosphate 3-phosphatidyltransferase